MWYVIQVMTGKEEYIRSQCERVIDKTVLEDSFIPYYEEKKKYKGEWHTDKKVLFPGYVFLVSDALLELFESLRKVTGLTKLLGTGEEIIPLTKDEVQRLERLGKKEHVVEMSVGVIENERVRILEGPLQGMEGCIRKIDRHKRKAWVEIEMFGGMRMMEVGCEIVGVKSASRTI